MINGVQTTFDNGFKVDVHTTSNRGWTPEERRLWYSKNRLDRF
jgi:hypothetical protein